ncbi:hypothetical protein lbkm_3819 [Lachnospiraceae bacterium KM106-2]|nr:hypothetical protein lbkm_3819 [Lachnospiraceae bacterium KM106-2]
MYLYHYYEEQDGPFRNLSDLPEEKAKEVLQQIKRNRPESFAAVRDKEYIRIRLGYEAIVRELFSNMGGRMDRFAPHYMVVGECPWLASWYENPAYIRIPIEEFDLSTLSFTYGDMHPTFSDRVNDGKEYRKTLYDYKGIIKMIKKYGLPQEWNADGAYGPERYIEVQVWSEDTISKYKNK